MEPGDSGTAPVSAALSMPALALVRPPVSMLPETHRAMVTFDVTQSMDVEDARSNARAVSRLTLARDSAREMLRSLPFGSEVGWSLFADYRVSPLLLPVEAIRILAVSGA